MTLSNYLCSLCDMLPDEFLNQSYRWTIFGRISLQVLPGCRCSDIIAVYFKAQKGCANPYQQPCHQADCAPDFILYCAVC